MAGNYGAGAGSIERHASASGRNRQKKQVHSLFSRGVMDLTFFLIVMTLLGYRDYYDVFSKLCESA